MLTVPETALDGPLAAAGGVDLYATESQYLSHLVPLWLALVPGERGTCSVPHRMVARAESEGLQPVRSKRPDRGGKPVLVASWQDSAAARAAGRPVVYVEHGAGQTYLVEHASYSGSAGHDGTVLFVCPSETVAGRWRARYPDVPAVAVGCPKLDFAHLAAVRRGPWEPKTLAGATVAVGFHSDVALVPETRSAWRHYADGMADAVRALRSAGAAVLGHAHPRLWDRVADRWAGWGAEPVEDFADVLARADAYAVDNSSTLYEAASCGLAVVAMNAPWYRRDVEHGMRFWSLIPGPQVDGPEGLVAAFAEALGDPVWEAERRRVSATVYAACDGRAAQRAADAVRVHALGAAKDIPPGASS